MTMRKYTEIQPDWLGKILAGILLGLLLALGCSGLFVLLTPHMDTSAQAQLAMWMVPPIWLGILSFVFFFRSGKSAWVWLGAVNLLIIGVLALARLQ
ncbi:hypothetical protein LGV61_03310 [Desulfurispirillum indicum]|uniref:hypothetical protein n=1 Tax=Desulfurispirillum indicum TaxID=936456 RepID=UPI001CFAAAC1|nr:hypothetical protein [Desulfurispirillum indicum]UCZ57322.1 hypothetical protein LGV61_03310 [Desulfurispirillum indicum]